jgi:hypothetical protein
VNQIFVESIHSTDKSIHSTPRAFKVQSSKFLVSLVSFVFSVSLSFLASQVILSFLATLLPASLPFLASVSLSFFSSLTLPLPLFPRLPILSPFHPLPLFCPLVSCLALSYFAFLASLASTNSAHTIEFSLTSSALERNN